MLNFVLQGGGKGGSPWPHGWFPIGISIASVDGFVFHIRLQKFTHQFRVTGRIIAAGSFHGRIPIGSRVDVIDASVARLLAALIGA